MKVYIYDEETKEYLYSDEAFKDPLESKLQNTDIYILPPNGTLVEPLFTEGYANLWNGEVWEQVEDNRGKEYWLDTDEYGTPARVMKELGKLPENAVFEAPKQTLESARTEKLNEFKSIREDMENQVVEYNYHFFDYDDVSKRRITDAITELSLLGGTKKWTTADNEAVEMTAKDLAGVVAEASKRSDSLHKQYQALRDKLESLTTVEEIKEVTWD